MSKEKKRDPIRTLVIWLVVFAVLAGGLWFGRSWLATYRADRLSVMQQEVTARNEEKQQAYQTALSDYQQEQAAANASAASAGWPTQKMEGWDIVDLTGYPLTSLTTEEVSRSDLMFGGLLLVNQWHSRPDDFDETDIVSVGSATSGALQVADYNVRLHRTAISAYTAALDAAKEIGLEHYMVAEGYRTYERQNELFTAQMEKLSKTYSGDELIERTMKSVNYPGTSEYNTGLAFRLSLYDRTDATVGKTTFSTSAQGLWFAEHCWEYGIVLRFPVSDFPVKGTVDKSYKTGISTKMNLYRYVGVAHATVMHLNDFCLEEYIEYLQEHPHIAVFEDGRLKYEIYRQEAGDADEVTVQLTGTASEWVSSLDNMGCVVTAFYFE